MPYPPRPVEGRKWGENGEGKGKRKYERGREGKKRDERNARRKFVATFDENLNFGGVVPTTVLDPGHIWHLKV